MLTRGRLFWASLAVLTTVFLAVGTITVAQQPLPDAPTPQRNAPPPPPPSEPAPDVTAPLPDAGNAPARQTAEDTPPSGTSSQTTNPEAPPPGSQGIKTVPAGKTPTGPGNDFDELYTLSTNVNFVSVPVTVKDHDGKLVDGLLAQDFSVYEDNVKQTLTFFTSDPFPLSAALIIDLGISENTLKKVSQTYSALDGSFGPFDKVSVFTYGLPCSAFAICEDRIPARL